MWKKSAWTVALLLAAGSSMPAAGTPQQFIAGQGFIGWAGTTVPPQVMNAGRQVITRSEQQTWGPAGFSEPLASLLNGPITFTVNCNFDANLRGPCFGSFTWEVLGGGTWEGRWTAPVMDLYTYESRISMVGVGNGGAINGRHLKVDGFSNPGDWYITVDVRIQ